MLENRFKTELVKELEARFPGCFIFHLDPTERQGIPDLLILFNDKWAALEGKRSSKAATRPNQQYYVDILDKLSFCRFIYPENKETVLDDLQRTFSSRRKARVSKR